MEVVAFVGPSGTGKSHRAIGVAHNNNCDAIIDDGLLIKGRLKGLFLRRTTTPTLYAAHWRRAAYTGF